MADDDGQGGGPDPVEELRRELADFKHEISEARKAETEAEERKAREQVAEAEEDVAAAAKRAGLKPADYQRALEAAKRQAFLDEYGEEIDRRVSERLEAMLREAAERDDADDEKDKDKPTGEGGAPTPKSRGSNSGKQDPEGGAPPSSDEPPDSGPQHPHWSEKKLTELFQ